MGNWRTEIKTAFANWMVDALGDDIKGFEAWNSQLINFDTEETSAAMQVYFEYSEIGDSIPYLKQTNIQQSARIPVVVTLHIVFDDYTCYTQDQAYDFANKIVCIVSGKKHPLIHGVILKVGEEEDTNHRADYDYRLLFRMEIFEVVGLDPQLLDANPEDGTNPDTGRKLFREVDADFK